MGPNFTPLAAPQNPPSEPIHPKHSSKGFNKRFMGIALMVLVVGVVSGYVAITNFFNKSRASTSVPPAYFYTPGYSLSFDGIFVTVNDSNGSVPLKVVGYKGNQPYWGETWTAVGSPTVTDVQNGSKVEVPCGDFQMDLIPRSFQVYPSPSYTGDRYGTPGAGVLKAAVNGNRSCTTQPSPTPRPSNTPTPKPTNTPTPKPPTSTPVPSPTPTRVPVCGSGCSSDSQCPTGLKCFNAAIGTYTSPTGKCVLAKCLVEGTVCSADKCTVIPPTPTPTPKPSNTPPPTATLSCPKPNPVKNLHINCPICKGS
ncbi:hypothetical protein HYS00_04515 [Candidatus Microgenomates bacterium]|nr:hypothetical protein [Candidatus Microgenomates bacterium]